MNKYETLYVVSTTLEDEAIAAKVQKFTDLIAANGGTVESTDEWGKRRLAYAIDYKTEGYYVLTNFEGSSELPRELERNFKNDESILRYIVIRREA